MDVRSEYLKSKIAGASQDELLIMLLEGAERFIRIAQNELEKKNWEGVHNNIVKAQNIYYELFSVLDPNAGDFVQYLHGLYYFMCDNLLEADIKKDSAILSNCMQVAEKLTVMWREVVDKYRGELAGSNASLKEIKSIDLKG